MPVYSRVRVGHVWLVDPILQTVEVYHLDGPSYRLDDTRGGTDPARLEPFAEIEIELARWWLEDALPAVSATPP
jgi:hypothetical protein